MNGFEKGRRSAFFHGLFFFFQKHVKSLCKTRKTIDTTLFFYRKFADCIHSRTVFSLFFSVIDCQSNIWSIKQDFSSRLLCISQSPAFVLEANIACNKSCLEDLADVAARISIKPDIPSFLDDSLLVFCIKGSLKVLFKHFSSMSGFNPSNVQFVTLLNMFSFSIITQSVRFLSFFDFYFVYFLFCGWTFFFLFN